MGLTPDPRSLDPLIALSLTIAKTAEGYEDMCDTFVVLPPFTADGSVIFGKNSDREPNEAQALEFHPAQSHPAGQTVKCTYLEIPQVRETHAVLLSRPFWMWGAEMGANEKGVVIGNEAVFTKMPLDRKGGLTGMDLLRLALERADTAEQAVETVIQLLADHGQGGICGYEDRRTDLSQQLHLRGPEGSMGTGNSGSALGQAQGGWVRFHQQRPHDRRGLRRLPPGRNPDREAERVAQAGRDL